MRLSAVSRTILAATLLASAASLSVAVTPASAQPREAGVHQAPHAVRVMDHRHRHRVWRHGHWVYFYR